jgi:hypothetical protein
MIDPQLLAEVRESRQQREEAAVAAEAQALAAARAAEALAAARAANEAERRKQLEADLARAIETDSAAGVQVVAALTWLGTAIAERRTTAALVDALLVQLGHLPSAETQANVELVGRTRQTLIECGLGGMLRG